MHVMNFSFQMLNLASKSLQKQYFRWKQFLQKLYFRLCFRQQKFLEAMFQLIEVYKSCVSDSRSFYRSQILADRSMGVGSQKDISQRDLSQTGHFIDRIGHFINRTGHRQDISQIGQDISQMSFHRQDIHRKYISQTGHFIDRIFIDMTFHRQDIAQIEKNFHR